MIYNKDRHLFLALVFTRIFFQFIYFLDLGGQALKKAERKEWVSSDGEGGDRPVFSLGGGEGLHHSGSPAR